ncbi:hypothetical protein C4577_07880 [Candidatus Parcubacteria bacterium]|nr:MAG: hypothetical protein C4577_07880 [Candidatus Parcubacteria bacterium]
MKDLALVLPTFERVQTPANIPSGPDTLSRLLTTGYALLAVAGITLSLIFIIYAGVVWITSGGNKEGVEKAKQTLTYAIIGLLVIVFSFVIINIIGQVIGAKFLMEIGT